MHRKPDWSKEGRAWPHRDASRFVEAGGLRWHVQTMGDGPAVLLLHGAGAASHSWRDMMPLLARDFTVIAPDLPGHGFTATPRAGRGLTLPGMAEALDRLLIALDRRPVAIVGHSAGAAIGARLAARSEGAKPRLVALNGAFQPFSGLAAHVFPVIAGAVALNPVTIRLLSLGARDQKRVARMLEGTGSPIAGEGLALYASLFAAPGHVAGVLGMMARWDLRETPGHLRTLGDRLHLIASAGDLAVPSRVSGDMHRACPGSSLTIVPSLGHLAHEEAPDLFATLTRDAVLVADRPAETAPARRRSRCAGGGGALR
jgi:magnesium chelatase accessory protein